MRTERIFHLCRRSEPHEVGMHAPPGNATIPEGAVLDDHGWWKPTYLEEIRLQGFGHFRRTDIGLLFLPKECECCGRRFEREQVLFFATREGVKGPRDLVTSKEWQRLEEECQRVIAVADEYPEWEGFLRGY